MLHFKCVQVRTVVTHIGWFLGPKKQDHFETERFWETNLKHKSNNNLILLFFFFSIRSFTYCSLNHTHPWPLQYFSSSIANKIRSIPKYLDVDEYSAVGESWKHAICSLGPRLSKHITIQWTHPQNYTSIQCIFTFLTGHLSITVAWSKYIHEL